MERGPSTVTCKQDQFKWVSALPFAKDCTLEIRDTLDAHAASSMDVEIIFIFNVSRHLQLLATLSQYHFLIHRTLFPVVPVTLPEAPKCHHAPASVRVFLLL